jgi:hypothetical protein
MILVNRSKVDFGKICHVLVLVYLWLLGYGVHHSLGLSLCISNTSSLHRLACHVRGTGLLLHREHSWSRQIDALVSLCNRSCRVDHLRYSEVRCLGPWRRVELHVLTLKGWRRGHHLRGLLTSIHLLTWSNWGKYLVLGGIRAMATQICGICSGVVGCAWRIGVKVRSRLELRLLLRLLGHKVVHIRLLLPIVHTEVTELVCSEILLVL